MPASHYDSVRKGDQTGCNSAPEWHQYGKALSCVPEGREDLPQMFSLHHVRVPKAQSPETLCKRALRVVSQQACTSLASGEQSPFDRQSFSSLSVVAAHSQQGEFEFALKQESIVDFLRLDDDDEAMPATCSPVHPRSPEQAFQSDLKPSAKPFVSMALPNNPVYNLMQQPSPNSTIPYSSLSPSISPIRESLRYMYSTIPAKPQNFSGFQRQQQQQQQQRAVRLAPPPGFAHNYAKPVQQQAYDVHQVPAAAARAAALGVSGPTQQAGLCGVGALGGGFSGGGARNTSMLPTNYRPNAVVSIAPVKFYDLYTTTIATMMSPENVLKMASLDKGKAVKRPQAAYGEAFSGAAALGKQATSVFGSPANPKRVPVKVAPVNVGAAPPSKGDAETASTSGGSGRSTPSGSAPDFTAMMGLMQHMASQVATLGQKVESLESNPTGPPAMSAEELAAVFQQKYAANLAGLPGGPSGGAANLTQVPDIQEMFKAASRSRGVSTKDSVCAAMVQRTQGATEN